MAGKKAAAAARPGSAEKKGASANTRRRGRCASGCKRCCGCGVLAAAVFIPVAAVLIGVLERELLPPEHEAAASLAAAPHPPSAAVPAPRTGAADDGASEGPQQLLPELFAGPHYDRPWTRWWWPGVAVDLDRLQTEMRNLDLNGFAGVEIQPMTWGVVSRPGESEYNDTRGVGGGRWRDLVAGVLENTKVVDIGVYLTLGSSWPSGGAHLPASQGLRSLVHSEVDLDPDGSPVTLPAPSIPSTYLLMRLLGKFMGPGIPGWGPHWYGEQAELVAVVAARVAADSNPWLRRWRRWAPTADMRRLGELVGLEDYCELDAASLTVLPPEAVERHQGGGALVRWRPPGGGQWRVVGVWQVPVGEHPIASAQETAGYVADHLSREGVTGLMDELVQKQLLDDPRIGPHAGGALQGIFIDSFEFKAERHWTPGFIDTFRKQRGYDPTRLLPAVFLPGGDHYVFTDGFRFRRRPPYMLRPGPGDPLDVGERLRHDWDQTTSDLMIAASCIRPRRWGDKRKLSVRIQAYGANIDVLKALGSAHIPETEMLLADGVEAFLRLAGSAACLYRRRMASAEAMISHKLAYSLTAAHLRAGATKLLAAGINHIIYHGTPYKNVSCTRERMGRCPHVDSRYGSTGWMPFASPEPAWLTMSEDFSELNTALWHEPLHSVNRYIGRLQHVMRLGRAEADVLAYYPWLGAIGATIGRPEGEESWAGGYVEGLDDPPSDPFGWWGELGKSILAEVGENTKMRWHRRAVALLRRLERAGAAWVWANGESLAAATCDSMGSVVVRGAHYRGVVVPAETVTMPPDVAEAVAALAAGGCAVHLADGAGPQRQPGLGRWREGDEAVRRAMAAVRQAEPAEERLPAFVTKMNRAALPHPETAPRLRAAALPPPAGDDAPARPPAVTTSRRLFGQSRALLLANHRPEEVEVEVAAPKSAAAALWLDPDTGSISRAGGSTPQDRTLRKVVPPFTAALLVIVPDEESAVTLLSFPAVHQDAPPPVECSAKGVGQDFKWSLDVDPEKDPWCDTEKKELEGPGDWRDDPALRTCRGPAEYVGQVPVGAADTAARWQLSLGRVCGSVNVTVGTGSGGPSVPTTVHWPPYTVEVTGAVRSAAAAGDPLVFHVEVAPPLRNHLKGLATSGEPGHEPHAGLPFVCAGIVGPVELRRCAAA